MTADAPHIAFMKMHGLGNDFVVVDERGRAPMVDSETALRMADRHRGIGFDQLAVMRDSDAADLHLTFGSVRYLAEWLWEIELEARSHAKAVES